jgi:DNA topoisomerase-1
MEKEGIGRPSTYASIIGTIIDRGYVKKMGNALVPTFTAMVVAKLLQQHLPQYVDLGFTSEMERALDDIAGGDLDQLKYLKSIYFGDKGLKKQVESQEEKINPEEARAINFEGLQGLSFRVGRYGAYVCRTEGDGEVCASLPEAQPPADITAEIANKLIDQKKNGTDALGKDPKTGEPVYVLTGRYGPYVQLGDATDENAKPKRVSLPTGIQPEDVKLEMAIQLLELPKTLGEHPGTGKDIKAGLGRFGPYVVHDGDFRSIPKTDNLFTITLDRALELMSKPKAGRGRAAPLKELGKVEGIDETVAVYTGKYGPYIKCGKVNVSVPEDMKPEDVTLEIALKLVEQKTGKAPGADEGGAKSAKASGKKAAKAKAGETSGNGKAAAGKKAASKAVAMGQTSKAGASAKAAPVKAGKAAPAKTVERGAAKSVVVKKAADKTPADKKASVRR